MKVKKKLRIFISNTFYPARVEGGPDGEETSVASWELRVEGRLLEDNKVSCYDLHCNNYLQFILAICINTFTSEHFFWRKNK